MPHQFSRRQAKARLAKAVEAVESRSSAEVMVVGRPWSGHYRHIDLAAGSALALLTLLTILFTDLYFTPLSVVINVVVAFVLGMCLMISATPLRLKLATRSLVARHVETLAQALFFRLGVHRTRDRSGILVFVSLLEKRCTVVPDVGVTTALGGEAWRLLEDPIERAVERYGVGPTGVEQLARAIEAMTEPLEAALPIRHDDINELPSFVDHEESID